jgi:toxin ParE1/3/4
MPYRVSLTRRARRDLQSLYDSINAAESPAAALWFNRLEDAILQLENTPRLGVVTHESSAVRQLIHGSKPHFYRVLYQVDDTRTLVIIRQIRHGRQQPFNPASF